MNNKSEIIRNWIEKAEHDLGTAIITFTHIPKYMDTIAFHCQQAVEKYLKAYLFNLEIEFCKSHDLVYLAELVNSKVSIEDEVINKLVILENYSVEIRYPDTEIGLTDDEIINALNIAKEIRSYIFNKLKLQNINHELDY